MAWRPCVVIAFFAVLCASSIAGSEWTFLDNGQLKLGVRRDAGACIGWLSASGSDRNLLNGYDTGRFVQQSYYGERDGSMWAEQPWRWNPVQGGHYLGAPATVLAFESKATTLYSKTLPKHWATGVDLPEVTMEQWIELRGKLVHVRFKMSYSGTKSHPATHQEIPAVFVDAALPNLVFYKGAAPWTHAPLTRVVPGWPNETQHFAEHWAAYVDDKDWGLGIFNARATEATTYRYLVKDGPPAASCSYLAPLATFAITPGLVFEYDVVLMIGTVAEMRESAYRLHSEAPSPPSR